MDKADTAKWRRRVQEWRASGLSSTAFSEGEPFSAGGLRHWAHRLRQQQAAKAARPVRIARVVSVPAAPLAETREPAPGVAVAAAEAALVVEVGAARVAVRPGFDRVTLAAVLEVLASRGGAR